MAIDESSYIRDQYLFPNHKLLHMLIKLHNVRARFRNILARFSRKKISPISSSKPALTDVFIASKKNFNSSGWAYMEGVFEENFHKELLENWPAKRFFKPIKEIYKSYDVWFAAKHQNHFPQNPIIELLYKYMNSEKVAQLITDFCQDGVKRKLYSFTLTRAFSGSSVIPHRDTVAETPEGKYFINILFFIDGTGGKNSGGLMIMDDPEYKKIQIEPKNLRNTALVYRSSDPFFHGFPPMKRGSFRYAIATQFCADGD